MQQAQQLMLIIVTAVTTRVLLHRTLLRVLPSISITRASCSALLLLYSSHYHTSGQRTYRALDMCACDWFVGAHARAGWHQ